MNREIKFRGKLEYNGKWIYGDLLQYENGDVAIFRDKLSSFGCECTEMLKRDRVIPDTIGQYTGLKDKNGVKIFEGDILTGQNCHFVVKYDERQAEFVAVNSTLPKGFGLPMSQTWIDETNKIICGNIHDNPELIK